MKTLLPTTLGYSPRQRADSGAPAWHGYRKAGTGLSQAESNSGVNTGKMTSSSKGDSLPSVSSATLRKEPQFPDSNTKESCSLSDAETPTLLENNRQCAISFSHFFHVENWGKLSIFVKRMNLATATRSKGKGRLLSIFSNFPNKQPAN